jgi:putative DNA methylase
LDVRKKLIEVALPLEAINAAASREKSIRHGHPSTLHLWWARRPLAACRAVLFGQLVDDPSSHPDKFPTEETQKEERKRLFGIIEQLVLWENSNNESVLEEARAEILKSCDGKPPAVLDPFCGGGSIPLEAQRLGLEAYASDLNPVAVLITKALVEIPPKFAGTPPVNPEARKKLAHSGSWRGAQGLAEDVRYYGRWMRDEAEKRIGYLYPKVKVTAEMAKGRDDLKGLVGRELTVIAWLWARTVKCPNPACGAEMPLVRSFALSTKPSKRAWVETIIDQRSKQIDFAVRAGSGPAPEGTVNRRGARCAACETAVPFGHVRAEGQAGRMGVRLMAIVVEGNGARAYLQPVHGQVEVAESAKPKWRPDATLPVNPRDFKTPNYGMRTFADLFTSRQLAALTTFSDLVGEARERALKDARAAGMPDEPKGIDEGGLSATAYADAVAVYLAFAVDKGADYWSSICSWHSSGEKMRNTFGRQAIPMVWDYAECCPFSSSTGNWMACVDWVWEAVAFSPKGKSGIGRQLDATAAVNGVVSPVIATDPPYYDNIGYADLSDFFYVWLRRSIGKIYPQLFSTLLVPKAQELVATPYRFDGSKEKAQRFFEEGLGRAFTRMREAQNPTYPLTLFYAFKQAETEENDSDDNSSTALVSTGWETMLEGLIRAGFQITGTWPMRSELSNRMIASGTNALASSVVLACRPRADDAPLAIRREFVEALRNELPVALKNLQHGSIAPVDLAQAAIGSGMAVFSRYSKVLETDGSAMRVRTALGLINQALDEVLAEQEGEYDPASRWAVAWFEQFGMNEGPYGVAETLSKAKDVSIKALADDGIVVQGRGKVRLLRRDELDPNWDPTTDTRLTVWEVTHHLIRRLETDGEKASAVLLRRVGALSEAAKDLAYRLYTICDRKGWSQEALGYNMLVRSWPELVKLASGAEQLTLTPQQPGS